MGNHFPGHFLRYDPLIMAVVKLQKSIFYGKYSYYFTQPYVIMMDTE